MQKEPGSLGVVSQCVSASLCPLSRAAAGKAFQKGAHGGTVSLTLSPYKSDLSSPSNPSPWSSGEEECKACKSQVMEGSRRTNSESTERGSRVLRVQRHTQGLHGSAAGPLHGYCSFQFGVFRTPKCQSECTCSRTLICLLQPGCDGFCLILLCFILLCLVGIS